MNTDTNTTKNKGKGKSTSKIDEDKEDDARAAVSAGVLSTTREGAAVHHLDSASQNIFAKLDGCDVIKKGHARKGRTCIILPGQLAIKTAGGVIGTLEKLDTKKPCMYIDFEQVGHAPRLIEYCKL